jgi:hypothetical protein
MIRCDHSRTPAKARHAAPAMQKRNRLTKLTVRKYCQSADAFLARTGGLSGRFNSR